MRLKCVSRGTVLLDPHGDAGALETAELISSMASASSEPGPHHTELGEGLPGPPTTGLTGMGGLG